MEAMVNGERDPMTPRDWRTIVGRRSEHLLWAATVAALLLAPVAALLPPVADYVTAILWAGFFGAAIGCIVTGK